MSCAAAQGATEICDPFCGSGTALAAANHMGMHAVGVDLSAKKARHARVMRLYRDAAGALVARRETDTQPGDAGAGAEAEP